MIDMLNYATRVVEFYEHVQRQLAQDPVYAKDAAVLAWVCEVINTAQKFRLPDGGRMYDPQLRPTVAGVQKILDLFRLPYSVTLIEYFSPEGHPGFQASDPNKGLFPSPKRLAVAIDLRAPVWDFFPDKALLDQMRSHLESRGEGAVILSSYAGHDNRWAVPVFGFFCPYTQHIIPVKDSDSVSPEMLAVMLDRGSTHASPVITTVPFTLLSQLARALARKQGSYERLQEDAMRDVADEATSIFEFCSVINCSNVSTIIEPASPPLNKKRTKNGKPPFFDYRVLVLQAEHSATGGVSAPSDNCRGAPRWHLRRGHIRRIGDADKKRMIWVNAAMVGNAQHGVLLKDYAVQPKPGRPLL